MSNPAKELARRLYGEGSGYKAIAGILSLHLTTVKRWRNKGRWNRDVPPCTQENVPPQAYGGPLQFKGVTWREMPGKNGESQRLNFSLFRRGQGAYARQCEGLEGPALIAKLQELSAQRRKNGKKGGGAWRKERAQ